MPRWYWWGVAACWIGLGVLTDVANAWVVAGAGVTFGAVHSAVSQLIALVGVTTAWMSSSSVR